MSLLKLTDVGMLYGGRVPALEHINLTVEKGDWLAVMGPSGSGKTTLMNIIGCMDKHTSGEVILDGINLNEVSKNELTQIRRDKIGMVFQQFHLIPYLTAVENLMVAQYYHSIPDKKEAMEALARVGLEDRAGHLPSELSGGEQQRVSIARALVTRPKLLLMDEPTAGMAPQERNDLMALTKQLVIDRGMAVLFTEHSMDVVFAYADRVIVLARGRLIAQGTPAEIRAHPKVQEVYFGSGKTFEKPLAKRDA